MATAYIRSLNPTSEYQLVEIIAMTPSGGVPPRPSPQPPLGIWGPTDPRPSHPIHLPGGGGGEGPPGIWGPTDPRPTHPIAGIPGLPGFGGGGGGVSVGVDAKIVPLPPSDPPTTPPAGMPASSSQALIFIEGAAAPIPVWIPPYASTGPVTPPPASPA